MTIEVEPGTYVVAVSGGVDSMVLLHLLEQRAESREQRNVATQSSALSLPAGRHGPQPLRLIVAHFDHGMREDAKDDRQFVQRLASSYNLPFVYNEGNLGAEVSEAVARTARYDFLHSVRKAAKANAIITAHHQDDVIETAIINMMRGTGRRGLTSLQDTDDVLRPLLRFSKTQIVNYAKEHDLEWHEDDTNQDVRYLRNYVRHKIVPKFSDEERARFLEHIDNLRRLNQDIDHALINHLHMHPEPNVLDRHWFIMLPHAVARDTMASWLRLRGVDSVDKKNLEKLLTAAKTLRSGKHIDVDKTHFIQVGKGKLALLVRNDG